MRQGSDGGSSVARQGALANSPFEIPDEIFEQVSPLCLALPEVTVQVRTGVRAASRSFEIRRRSFCLLAAWEDPTGKPISRLVLRALPDDRDALLWIGHPFYANRAGHDRIEVRITDNTDWEWIRELVIESYRVLAPKKLIALLD
jgi:hypothetical protein